MEPDPRSVDEDEDPGRHELVKVASGRNQAEAEFIQNLLKEEGIPSMLKRSRGFDVPDMLAAGPRDVLVPRWSYASASETLLHADLVSPGSGPAVVDAPGKILLALVAALAVAVLVLWVGTELL